MDYDEDELIPIIYVLSDARGHTANTVLEAAIDQFEAGIVDVERISSVSSVDEIHEYFSQREEINGSVPCAVFHTIVDPELRRSIRMELDSFGIPSIDLIGPAISVLASLTGEDPKNIAGSRHK